MKWRKKGLIFEPTGNLEWMRSYALNPTVDIVNDDTLRIYFASVDSNMYGRIGFIDTDSNNFKNVKYVSDTPVVDLGERGTFDDCGVNPSCILTINEKKYLYYYGWQRCEKTPHMLFAGLAISEDGGTSFKKVASTPILDRTPNEPFLRSATTILFEDNLFKCWYVSAIKWIDLMGKLYPKYVIKYTYSHDGIDWISTNHICINFKNEYEFGFGRPWIIKENGIYKMWYSIRSIKEPYKIGYAESKDGLEWVRLDNILGLERSKDGWDSEMICYPCVIDINNKRYMFYNGNQHGKTGFGYAVLEE